uniref:dolichyl-phosphate-mannose--protein mannosyltransferase n=1 Tax=Strigamia maritima TaxID=126957 RepID=T1ITR6_STRMM
VTGVVARAELLSSIFFLAAFFAYVKATKAKQTDWTYLLATLLLSTVALLCKEQGIMVLTVCIVYEICVVLKIRLQDIPHMLDMVINSSSSAFTHSLREASRRIITLVVFKLFLIVMRLKIMNGQLPTFTKFDNPSAVAPTPVRYMTYNYLLAVNAWLLLFPHNLCCDWTMGTIPCLESALDPRHLATVGFYLSFLKLARVASFRTRHATVVLMSLAIIVFPFLPASNLFFPVGFVIAERTLYTPSMGFCILVAYGWNILLQKSSHKKMLWIGLLFLMLMHASKTLTRNLDWESEYSIFMASLRVNQRNAKLYNNVGHTLENVGKYEEALQYFHQASAVQPDDVTAYINMGRLYNNLKMYEEAESTFSKAKDLLPKPRPGESYYTKIAPHYLTVFTNLASLISKNDSRLEEADALYLQVIRMRADYTHAYINRGDILIKMNRTKEAQEIYETALRYDSRNPDIYYNLGVVSWEQGRATEALAYLNKALEFDPDHKEALMNSAILIQETGNAGMRKTAHQRLLRMIEKGHGNEKVYLNLGMLAIDDNDLENAERWLRKAVQAQEDFRSALYNLALLLSHKKKPLEAAPFLHQLLKNHPDHIKGLILLGDIYVNNIRDLDAAEQCYRRVLAFDSNHIQGHHNFCVIYVERGDLEAAEQCFVRAVSMAPHVDYIKHHLQTVRRILEQKRLAGPSYNNPYHITEMDKELPMS